LLYDGLHHGIGVTIYSSRRKSPYVRNQFQSSMAVKKIIKYYH
jgi:hypothetical protein